MSWSVERPLFIPVILGTARKGRMSTAVANLMVSQIAPRAGVTTELIDMSTNMTPTRLYLVRHGATQMTAEDRFSGADGAELSDEGRHQAARLAERLRDEGIVAAYSSPLSRSLDTARIVADCCGLTPILRDTLREIGHGDWEGLTRRQVEERFPKDYAAWEEDPGRIVICRTGGKRSAESLKLCLSVSVVAAGSA